MKGLWFARTRIRALWLIGLFALAPVYAGAEDTSAKESKQAEIRVVASIFPVYVLARDLVGDLGRVDLLVEPSANPHATHLHLSRARHLRDAGILFYIADEFEYYVPKLDREQYPLERVALAHVAEIELFPVRRHALTSGEDDEHSEHSEHSEHHGHSHAGNTDYHIWLDPIRAISLVRTMARKLTGRWHEQREALTANADALVADIERAHARAKKTLGPVRDSLVLFYHDAFQYLEKRYGLHSAGVAAYNPELKLSLKQVQALRALLNEKEISCLITDPHTSSGVANTLLRGTSTRQVLIDPVGADRDSDVRYSELLTGWVEKIRDCMQQ